MLFLLFLLVKFLTNKINEFDKNFARLHMLYAVGEKKGATPAQLSLAWMLHKRDFIVPIPGMRRDERLVENFEAADVVLTEEEYGAIEKALSQITVYGNRTDADIAKLREME